MDLFRLLQRANLSNYYEAFVSNGGDDLNQLLEASDEELHEILRVVGMEVKPLHIIRLKKAINEFKSMNDEKPTNLVSSSQRTGPDIVNYNNNSAVNNILFNMNDSLRNYMMSSAQGSNNMPLNGIANNFGAANAPRGIPVNLLPNATLNDEERSQIDLAAEDLIKAIPEYPVKDPSNSRKREAGLFEVIKMTTDHQSRIPAIYKYSAIYGRFNRPRKTGKVMNHHEVSINEAAAQLAIRMPSLLSRREDLYPLAREVVNIAESSLKNSSRSVGRKKKKTNKVTISISDELNNFHQNNAKSGLIRVQEKIDMMKAQLSDMILKQDKYRMAFRLAKNGHPGSTMAEIQKQMDALSSEMQLKIVEIGSYVIELRKFKTELQPSSGEIESGSSELNRQQFQASQHLNQPNSRRVIPSADLSNNKKNSTRDHISKTANRANNSRQLQHLQDSSNNINNTVCSLGSSGINPSNLISNSNIFANGLSMFPSLALPSQFKSEAADGGLFNFNQASAASNLFNNGGDLVRQLNNSQPPMPNFPPGLMSLSNPSTVGLSSTLNSTGNIMSHQSDQQQSHQSANDIIAAASSYADSTGSIRSSHIPYLSVFTSFNQLKNINNASQLQQNGMYQTSPYNSNMINN